MHHKGMKIFSPIVIATILLTLLLSSTRAAVVNLDQGRDNILASAESVQTSQTISESIEFYDWNQRGTANFAPDRVIVKFRENRLPRLNSFGRLDTGSQSLNDVLLAQGVEKGKPLFPKAAYDSPLTIARAGLEQIQRLYLKPDSNVMEVIATLSAHPDVIYAEPDYLAHAAFTPDDPRYWKS